MPAGLWATSSTSVPPPHGTTSSRPGQRTPSSASGPIAGSSTRAASRATAALLRWCAPARPTGARGSGEAQTSGLPTSAARASITAAASGPCRALTVGTPARITAAFSAAIAARVSPRMAW